MFKVERRWMANIVCLGLLVAAGCGQKGMTSMTNDVTIASSGKVYPNATVIELKEDSAYIEDKQISEYDYTWNCDPSESHDEVKNAPAEYYTGDKPETNEAVYIDHELYYYPMLDESGFKKVNYDGEQEWAYYYTDGVNNDYIFATLPVLGESIPAQMMHTEEEAMDNKVLHITKAGTYVLTGSWKGQVNVNLGEDAYADEECKVTLILDGADIECSVAPGIIFYNAYECDNTWEEAEVTDSNVDTESAGAVLLIADDSENYVLGQNVFRMLKTKYKDEDSTDKVKLQKKMRKTDGALYSYVSMNICGGEEGNGKLTVDSGFEGIDSELHLSVYGGNIVINSQDDGMNVNEDHVSVISFFGGNVTINAALGREGDGVDSNGYIVVNGGSISVNGIRVPDSALDSEDGIYYYSGDVIIDGEKQEYESGSVFRETRAEGSGFGNRGPRDGDFEGERPMGGDFGGKGQFGEEFDEKSPFGEGFDGKRPGEGFDGKGPGEGGFEGGRPENKGDDAINRNNQSDNKNM